MADRFNVDDVVTLTNTFKVSGTETDPTTVTLEVTDPSGNTDTYTHAAGTITKSSTGVFTKDVTADEAGLWHYTWTGTGAAADVADGSFRVFTDSDSTLYCTIEDLKESLGVGDTADDLELQIAARAASRAIDEFARRFFYRNTTTRYYTPRHQDILFLDDDLVSVTTLKTDPGGDGTFEHTWTANTDYLLEPLNAAATDRPYTQIRKHPSGSYHFPTNYPRTVEIAGTFGWSEPPAEVTHAAILQASRLWKRATEAPFGVAGVGLDGAGIRLLSRLDADVEMLVRPYRRQLVG